MGEYSGEDLLQIFQQMNIEVGNLQRIIKAWFDTDCPKTASILNFLCVNLTAENCLSAQEVAEYHELTSVFHDSELENEARNIEIKYPQIFDSASNKFEIEILEDEIKLLEDQLRDSEHQLKINKKLKTKLMARLSNVSEEEIRTKVNKEEAEDKCMEVCQDIEKINLNLYNQIVRYQMHLYNFLFDHTPQFINNCDISTLDEQFNEILPFINATNDMDLSTESNNSEALGSTLSELQDRIFQSHLNLVAQKMEYDHLKHLNDFLNKYNLKTDHSGQLELKLETEKSQKNLMLNIVENCILQHSEFEVTRPRLKCAQAKLKNCLTNLNLLCSIDNRVGKILSYYVVLNYLYTQERTDIKGSSKLFAKVISFINNNLKNVSFRCKGMEDVIEEFKQFSSQPIEKQYKLIEESGKLLTNNENSTLPVIVEAATKLRTENKCLEKNVFVSDVHSHFISTKNMSKDIEVLRAFLTSGPTRRILTIPLELQIVCLEINANLKSQGEAVKAAIKIFQNGEAKFIRDKKMVWHRQLWKYFLVNPSKMFALLETVKEKGTMKSSKQS